MKTLLKLGAAIALSAAMATSAWSQAFPEKGKNITIIVPTAAGGSTDVGTRILAAEMEKILGVPVQVTNKPGATGLIGLTEMALSKPDGYTLSAFAVIAHVASYVDKARKPAFGRKDIQPVGAYGQDDLILTVKGDGPYKSINDLIEAARANPGKIRVASSGVGGGPYLCWVMIEKAAGIDLNLVQFDGGTSLETAVAGGHVDASIASIAGAMSLVKAGALRGINLTGEGKNEHFPDIPNLKAAGVDVSYSARYGLAAPAGVPQDIIKVLADAMEKALENPEVQQRIKGSGMTPRYHTPAQFADFWTEGEKLVEYGLQVAEKERQAK